MRPITRLLWALAALTVLGAVKVTGPAGLAPQPSSAVAPAIDIVIPTATWNGQCVAGMYADVLCRTDNSTVTYYMDSSGEYELETADRTAVHGALARYNNLDPTITYDSTPVFSGSGETDFVYQEGSFGLEDYVKGITWCNDPQDGTRHLCDQHYIRIRGAGNYTETTAGHESGHAFGLTHGQQASPILDQCAEVLGVMRAKVTCAGPALGDLVRRTINDTY